MSDLAALELRVATLERLLALAPHEPAPVAAPRLRLGEIIRRTAAICGVAEGDVLGPLRGRAIVRARFAAVYVARILRPDASFPMIGEALGDRDHTTILNAQRRAAELRESDAEFRELTDTLVAVLRETQA